MARIRTIKPQFWEDERIGQLSIKTRLLYIGIWNFADDEGVIIWRPEYIRSRIFPYDDFSLNEIKKLQDELISANLLYSYKDSTDIYAVVLNFRKHQVINRPVPSHLPAPNWQNANYKNAIFKRDHFLCAYCGKVCEAHSPAEAQTTGLSIDHIIPRSKGGSDYPSNLTTSCASCNKSKCDNSVNNHGTVSDKSVTDKEEGIGIRNIEEEHREGNGSDGDLAKVIKIFESCGGTIATPMLAEKLKDITQEYGLEIVIAAFEKAAAGQISGPRIINYCQPIFEQYKTNGIPSKSNGNKKEIKSVGQVEGMIIHE